MLQAASDSCWRSFFSALRSSDLIYAGIVDRYLLGKTAALNDLMSWNADGTRMPYRMHSQYLHQLFLENRLARGQFEVEGRPVPLLCPQRVLAQRGAATAVAMSARPSTTADTNWVKTCNRPWQMAKFCLNNLGTAACLVWL